MSQLDAKWAGTCRKCGQSFPAGTRIDYVRGAGSAHVTCPTPSVATASAAGSDAADAPFVITRDCGRSKPMIDGEVGQTLRMRSKPGEVGKVVTVVRQHRRWVSEDGLSFGLSDDSGWVLTLCCREATEKERARLEADEAQEQAARAEATRIRDERRALEQLFLESGERPAGSHDVEGEEIPVSSSARAYGGGSWLIIEPAAFVAPTDEEIAAARAAVAPLLASTAAYSAFFDAQRARQTPADWQVFYAAADGRHVDELPEELRPLAQASADARAAMAAAKPEGGWWLPQRAWERMEAWVRRARDGRSIWFVVNNGADGDDWSANNVRTGGAGAVGRRLPWSEELEQRARSVSEKPEQRSTAKAA